MIQKLTGQFFDRYVFGKGFFLLAKRMPRLVLASGIRCSLFLWMIHSTTVPNIQQLQCKYQYKQDIAVPRSPIPKNHLGLGVAQLHSAHDGRNQGSYNQDGR